MSHVEKEREDMRQQLAAQKQQCRSLLQQIAALGQEQQRNVTLGGGKKSGAVGGRGDDGGMPGPAVLAPLRPI